MTFDMLNISITAELFLIQQIVSHYDVAAERLSNFPFRQSLLPQGCTCLLSASSRHTLINNINGRFKRLSRGVLLLPGITTLLTYSFPFSLKSISIPHGIQIFGMTERH